MTQIGKHMETMAKDQHSSSTATSQFLPELRGQLTSLNGTNNQAHADISTLSRNIQDMTANFKSYASKWEFPAIKNLSVKNIKTRASRE